MAGHLGRSVTGAPVPVIPGYKKKWLADSMAEGFHRSPLAIRLSNPLGFSKVFAYLRYFNMNMGIVNLFLHKSLCPSDPA